MRFLLGIVVIMMVCLTVFTLGAEVSTEQVSAKFKISFSQRFRFEGWDNAVGLDEDANDASGYTRNRTSLAALWNPSAHVEVMVKLTNEFRHYLVPKNKPFKIHEIFFDQLYVKWKNIGQSPLTLTVGRQNIMFGEGFVMMDGNALDGSRSLYFNALRADYQWSKNQRLTAFYSYQPVTDTILPLINHQDQPLVDQPEGALGLYYTGLLKKTGIEAYFIHKYVDRTDKLPIESGINTFGTRVQHSLLKDLSLTMEGAYQFGSYGAFDRSALAGYGHLDYTLSNKVPLLRTLTLGGIYLGGDNPATAKMEGWDPVYSRWPKWSESYIYTLAKEHGVAYWSNLKTLYLSFLMDLTPGINLTMTYFRLGAVERGKGSFTGGAGKTRGDLIMGRVNMKINTFTTAHFIWEHFNPGDFYFTGADNSNWLRFEVMFQL